jgi:hypothetical protein
MVIAWSGQFVVSKSRILANPYETYQQIDDMIEAPADHWLHNVSCLSSLTGFRSKAYSADIHQLWGPDGSGGPSNPTFGHVLERSWPTIFDCMDPNEIEESCFGETVGFGSHCSCRDN